MIPDIDWSTWEWGQGMDRGQRAWTEDKGKGEDRRRRGEEANKEDEKGRRRSRRKHMRDRYLALARLCGALELFCQQLPTTPGAAFECAVSLVTPIISHSHTITHFI